MCFLLSIQLFRKIVFSFVYFMWWGPCCSCHLKELTRHERGRAILQEPICLTRTSRAHLQRKRRNLLANSVSPAMRRQVGGEPLREERFLYSVFCKSSRCCCYCSVAKSYPALCDPMDCSMPGFPVLHHLLEFAQTHIHWVDDAIQPSHPLLPSSPAHNLCQHQGLFQWIGSSHQVAKVLEF